jgi:hypothetical protein
LADVLLAIEKMLIDENSGIWGKTDRQNSVVSHWNLRKDDLNEQSEETIDFLAELLAA